MEKLKQEVFRLGTKHMDHQNLTAFEAITMAIVAVLAVTLGTIYGDILF